MFVRTERRRQRIAELTDGNPDYWTFSAHGGRNDVHGYFRYPARMVPRVQRALLDTILELQSRVRSVLDPFAGAGTVLRTYVRP